MPRIPPWLFRRARHFSPHVATLLPATRDIPSALNELRWIREHVQETCSRLHDNHVTELCSRRGRGEPLQYVLGSQPFGPLDMKCQSGVLIPRPETEAYTAYLAQLLKFKHILFTNVDKSTQKLSILDFCTGTGCIPLLLYATLRSSFARLTVQGVDISPDAVELANANISHNVQAGNMCQPDEPRSLSIVQGDMFDENIVAGLAHARWDVLVSNPPYISGDVWNHGRGQLGYSVRKFEPRLALVPEDRHRAPKGVQHEDIFYARLLDLGKSLQIKILLMEIGDQDQALRVATLFNEHDLAKGGKLEFWRDWPDLTPDSDEPTTLSILNRSGHQISIPVKGNGNLRSLYIETQHFIEMETLA